MIFSYKYSFLEIKNIIYSVIIIVKLKSHIFIQIINDSLNILLELFVHIKLIFIFNLFIFNVK